MVLLERDLHLKALGSALGEAAIEGRVALVYGEAGIGKTSLVEHFVEEQKNNSWRVLQGACDSLFTPRPLGPLHDIASQTQGNLLNLLDSESNRAAVFSACLNELTTRKTILLIEDIHWADEATLDLLKYLGRRIRQTTSLMILTYRDDEIGIDHPLRILLGDLASSQAFHRIPVSALTNEAVRELAINKNIDPIALHDMTNGNPFFVTEVLTVGSGIPETVRDAVLARAARLSLSARAVLEAAAVIGSRIEPWLLSNIVGAESENVEECIAAGMLQSQSDDYAFRHELARQTILESISPQKKLALHRMTLTALKESPETHNDLARLANHAEGTKDVTAVLEYAPAAAQQASAASSHREAIALYQLALRFADSLPPAEHAQMLEAYVSELQFTNRYTDLITALQKVIVLWGSMGNRLREGMNLADLSTVLADGGRNTESEVISQSAVAMLEALPPSAELAWAYTSQCFLRMMIRDCADAVMWGEKAIALAEYFEDAEKLARAYNYTGCAMMIMDYERGRSFLEQSVSIAREENLPRRIASALGNLAGMSVEVYEFTNVNLYLKEGIDCAIEHDDDYNLVQTLSFQALIYLYQGRWAESAETAMKVLQRLDSDLVARTYAANALGRLSVRRGDTDALALFDEALALSIQADAIPRIGTARAARAEACWLASDHNRALAEACAAYDIAVSKKHPWVTGELAFWRWRAGEKITPPSWTAKPFALQIAGNWQGAAKEWEERGCPYEQGMALMDGNEAAQIAALEIFERLGARPIMEKLKQQMRAQGIRIPRGPRPATRENPFGLTAREMEVATLITQGKSNREIAKVMTVGEKTIETYVTRILNKLNFESRVQIATWAIERGLFSSTRDS
ncbi:MAG: AAA family ATPase [Anaerolineae bacterium]|nr:AAA family ATPase [Anaerolineae bacterium]